MATNDTLFDFDDLFNLIFNYIPKTFKKVLFQDLLGCLYQEAGEEIEEEKLDRHIYDIRFKRAAFSLKVRERANGHILEDVALSLTTLVEESVIHQDEFMDKLLYLAKRDTESFHPDDHAFFACHKEQPTLILAYILLRIVALSADNLNKKHSANYDPFAEYHMAAHTSSSVLTSSAIQDVLVKTSAYMYQSLEQARKSMPAFHSALLSKAITYETYKYEFHMQRSFSIVSGSDDEYSLEDFTHIPDNLLLVGEGGIGKTTFLYSRLKSFHDETDRNSIPLYLKLSDCSTNTDSKHMILDTLYKTMSYAVNGSLLESHKDLLDEFSRPCQEHGVPSYTLLLDGFNELPATDFGEIRSSIAEEINDLLQYPNLRIILTSREVDLYGISLNKFMLIKANGISKKDVTDYLCATYPEKVVHTICQNTELMEYLRIPLFLMMYTSVISDPFMAPKSRGAILYHFYNGDHSFYTEKKHSDNSYEREVALFTRYLLDFLIPDIGNFMVSNEVFHISETVFLDLLKNCICDSERFFSLRALPHASYHARPNSLRRVVKAFSELDYEDILLLLTDSLGILTRDGGDRLYFTHQYIRDYFSALYIVRELLYITLISDKTPDALSDLTYQWGDLRWNNDQKHLLHELLDFKSDYQQGDLIYDVIQLFRTNNIYPLKNNEQALSNLIGVLALNTHGDLSNYDFSYLDLRNCNLTNLNFHNIKTNISSSFTHSKIGLDTFITDAHIHDILKWSLSDDGRYIISISSTLEFKVWNIATQSCIYTRKNHEPMDNFHSVGTLELYKNGTLALITYLDQNQKMIMATTYQLKEDIQTIYMDRFTYNPSYLGIYYLPDTNRLLAIGYNGICEFEIGNRHPVITHPYPPQSFLERFFACHQKTSWDPVDMKHPLYLIHPLAGGTFLYIEAMPEDKTYNITYHIYDYINGCFSSLHTQQDSATEELSCLLAAANESILRSHIAVSRDGSFAAFLLYEKLYIYEAGKKNKTLCILSNKEFYNISHISFCHPDNHTLTLAGSTLYHFHIKTGEILYQRNISTLGNQKLIDVTANHLLFHVSANSKKADTLQFEDLYTGKETTLRLSSKDSLVNAYISEELHKMYTLHHNGTLLFWNADTLSLENSYNYAVDRQVLMSDYSEEHALLCFVSTPKHASTYSSQSTLTKVDLHTGTYVTSTETFHNISTIRITADGRYIIVATEKELYLVDISTLDSLSCSKQLYGGSRIKHIFSDGNLIHLASYQPVTFWSVNYHEIIVSYQITADQTLLPTKVTYVPSLALRGATPAVCFTMLDSWGFSLVKALDPDTKATIRLRTLTYGKPEEFNHRSYFHAEYIDYPLSSWAPACINADNPALYVTGSDRDIDIQTFDKCFKTFDSNIVYKNGAYYEHRLPENTYIDIYCELSESINPICYSRSLSALYCFDAKSQQFLKYSIKEQKLTHISIELYSNFLLYGCNFNDCTGLYHNPRVYMWGPYTGEHIPTELWKDASI